MDGCGWKMEGSETGGEDGRAWTGVRMKGGRLGVDGCGRG